MTTIKYRPEIEMDLAYLRDRISSTTDPDEKQKLLRQYELLDDALVIHNLSHNHGVDNEQNKKA